MQWFEGNAVAVLLQRFRQGDREAGEQLAESVSTIFIRYFARRYANRQVVEDLAQEACVRLLCHLPALQQPQKFSFFVAKVALHVHRAYLHHRYTRIEHRYEGMEATAPADFADLELDLERALGRLPDHHQEILRLKTHGFTEREIAHSLGLSRDSVKSIVKRSRKKLKIFLCA
ncbi:MAG: sigma-70 family RNA polymerase sigma factor [Calditrichaeota bacterium]|nr:MAG: sigma-70 family RNA polymerase sigma factor [Calditrichota bacterium]